MCREGPAWKSIADGVLSWIAGRVRDARRLCEETSQHWRSASLGGGGPAGPIPLGAAAYQVCDGNSHHDLGLRGGGCRDHSR